jgi:hypothetical protein
MIIKHACRVNLIKTYVFQEPYNQT